MKEMTWNKEEATKRLAIVYADTRGSMEKDASRAATAPVRKLREKLFDDAVEKSNIMTGLLMAAASMGINPNEIADVEVDPEERVFFMKEFAEHAEKMHAEDVEDAKRVGLGELLSELFG